MENKISLLFEELGVEKLNLESEKQLSSKLNLEIADLNKTIQALNNKLSELDQALSLSINNSESKEVEIESLKVKLDEALKEKIGELSEYRSEFFGRLKGILKRSKRNKYCRR